MWSLKGSQFSVELNSTCSLTLLIFKVITAVNSVCGPKQSSWRKSEKGTRHCGCNSVKRCLMWHKREERYSTQTQVTQVHKQSSSHVILDAILSKKFFIMCHKRQINHNWLDLVPTVTVFASSFPCYVWLCSEEQCGEGLLAYNPNRGYWHIVDWILDLDKYPEQCCDSAPDTSW